MHTAMVIYNFITLYIYNIDSQHRWKIYFHFYSILDNFMFGKNGVHICMQNSADKLFNKLKSFNSFFICNFKNIFKILIKL